MQSKKGKRRTIFDNIARFFQHLRHGPSLREADDGTWRMLLGTAEPVRDDDVITAIKAVPPHFNVNSTQYVDSAQPWQSPDPFPGQTVTTFGASPLSHTYEGGQSLQSIAGSGTESRTLNDPVRGYMTLGLTLVKKSTVNLQVMGNIPWWLQGTLNNFTQNGNFGIFSAIDQTLQLFSVPTAKAVGATYTAVHNSPATVGPNGLRWSAVFSDGATVN